ncbi:TIM barrel protein [Rhodococcus pseudokoreensis]|uniref:TIM barrel protein n=1 Tax=Rhodococcus pseudokoreensis TaxID=2811421 RepID=A0A974ZTI3_9NOCA|nr:TIM barrel protein [Rhodococcus pseudokoreensis]QSE89811.1 TIM barrel protein [Rhodococcus pseudokoreensis]
MQYRRHQLSANVSILFTEYDYLDRFAAARAAGFDAVETWWPFATPTPPRRSLNEFLAAVDSAGVRLTGLNFWAGDMAAGQRGMAVHADRHDELRANIALVADIAATTGCRHFNLLYGQLASEQSPGAAAEVAAEAFREAVAALRPLGGTILLEPLAHDLNGAYPIRTIGDALSFLDDYVDAAGTALLFDTFHLGHNGEDIVAAADTHAARIGHVQIADDPGRGAPGTGELPIDACLDALARAGYTGRVGVEYKPSTPTTSASLTWLRRTNTPA